MKRSLPWLKLRPFLLTLAFTLVWSVPRTCAQTPSEDSDDNGENAPPALTVTANLENEGKSAVSAYASGDGQANPDLEQALQSAFGCVLAGKSSYFRAVGVSYFGSCSIAPSKSALLHVYRINTKPLRDYATQHNLQFISVQLTLPDAEFRETSPTTKNFVFPSKRVSARARKHLEGIRAFRWRSDAAFPDYIEVRAGFDSAATPRRAALLLTALFAPILLALWLRRRALGAQTADKPSLWFSYIRYQQWMLTGFLLGWWTAAESVHLDGLLRFVLESVISRAVWLPSILSSLLTWIPPVLVWVICVTLSQPVQEKLRGVHWTRKELALQATYSIASSLLPLLPLVKGITAAATGNFRAMVLLFIAAFVIKVAARLQLAKLLGMLPQALTTGELRDTAFAMAARLNVKLQQIYVIPAGKGQMANAFARTGNSIGFTDYLLQRMTRREVNYVLAHELTHLRLKHLQKLSFAIIGGVVVASITRLMFQAFLPESVAFQYGSMVVFASLVTYFWARRFEFAADAGAVETTADPEAAISALFKLSSLNMHPLQWSKWSEKWLTHPSTLRRAQAIAKKASIHLERLPEIARASVQDHQHYSIPASATPGHKLDSTTTKTHNMLWISLSLVGVMTLIPTAFALFVKYAAAAQSFRGLVYLLGALVTAVAYFALVNRMAPRNLRSLIPLLRQKVQSQGVPLDSGNPISVGLAPAAVPRMYEGHSHWDLGFLFTYSDRICYWGEETRFSLRRDQITAIALGPASPNWFRPHRIYIAWRDLEHSACGVFSVASAEPRTLLAMRKRNQHLFDRLVEWHKASSRPTPLPMPLDSLTSPQFGNVTGISPLQLRKGSKVLKELELTALFAAAVAVVAGLPFHFMQLLTQMLTQAQGLRPAPPHGPGSGWYVVAVTVAVRLLAYVPFFFYKERSVVQAALPSSATQSPTATRLTKSELEPVLK